MPQPASRFLPTLLAAAALAACAGNPSPDEAAVRDTTGNAGVMAAPAPDSARPDTAVTPTPPPAYDTTMSRPADTTRAPVSDSTLPPASAAMTTPSAAATAQMKGTAGRDFGTLTLSESATGITVSGTLSGLPPGTHGFHIHEVGKCEGPTFETAGAHWNPTGKAHGSLNPAGPHLGDMANITVGSDSTVNVQVTTPGGTLHGENALLDDNGAAIVIHADADDYKSNPSGNSGNRIACGVVTGG